MVRLLIIFFVCSCLEGAAQAPKPKIIFDTDIGPDYDDVGALAMLHAFADQGECEVLATIASNNYRYIVPVLSVLNTYFRRPDLPIGMVHGKGVALGVGQKWDSVVVKKYPHALATNDDAEDAVALYRKILASQDDNSVTIVTVGFLTNMANLLTSKPDKISPLNGINLVQSKVQKLVSMAGAFPSGSEFNIRMDAAASKYAFDHWPTPVYFTGWEIGAKVLSGLPFLSSAVSDSPVRDVFAISIPKSREDSNGRKSWDQTAVLMAVRGVDHYYTLVPGRIICYDDGKNGWNSTGSGHYYAVEKTPVTEVEKLINELMIHQPKSKR